MSARRPAATPAVGAARRTSPCATVSRLEAVLRTGLLLRQSAQSLEPAPATAPVGMEPEDRKVQELIEQAVLAAKDALSAARGAATAHEERRRIVDDHPMFGSDSEQEADDRTFNFYGNGAPAHGVTWENLLGTYYFERWFDCDVVYQEEPGLREKLTDFLGKFYVARYASVFEGRYHVSAHEELENEWNAQHPGRAWWRDEDGVREFVKGLERQWKINVEQGDPSAPDAGVVDGCQDSNPPAWRQILGAYYFEQWLPYECLLHKENADPALVCGLKGVFGDFYVELYQSILDGSRLPDFAETSNPGDRRARSRKLVEGIETEWAAHTSKKVRAAGPSGAGAGGPSGADED